MKRNFNSIDVSPDEVMTHMVQQGTVSLSRYMQWLNTDKSWRSTKEVIMNHIMDTITHN